LTAEMGMQEETRDIILQHTTHVQVQKSF
jgi:hypothetical protein